MNDRISIICNDCKKPYTVSFIYWKQNKSNTEKIWRCKSCNAKYKSNLNKNRWKNLTDEDRRNISNKQSQTQSAYWQRTSKEDRIVRLNSFINAGKNYWDNISEDEKNEVRKRCKQYYDNLTDDEKLLHAKKSMEWYNNLSDKEKCERNKHRSEKWHGLNNDEKKRRVDLLIQNNKKWLDSLSKEEKDAHYQNNATFLRNFWKDISENQKLSWFYLTNKAQINSDILQEKKSPSEIDFINYLNIYKLPYEYQYMNETYPEYFYEIFDKNKSPYHKWDFIIHTKLSDILVDIDGSEHSIPEGQCITKDGIDIGKSIQENDAKRPFQTDGLEAFIVLAYDDNTKDDTLVYNIK